MKKQQQAGFTIIELMIATLVFSVILLIITAGIISLTNQYYKGVTSSNTQSVARSVMDTITQDIQFSSGTLTPPRTSSNNAVQYFCTGNNMYTYKLGFQLKDGVGLAADQTNSALVTSPVVGGSCPSPATVTGFPTSGTHRELLNPGMRVANLNITPGASSNSWTVEIRLASGDSDLLNNPQPVNPNNPATQTSCRSGSGSQFCAVSELTTTVEERLQ